MTAANFKTHRSRQWLAILAACGWCLFCHADTTTTFADDESAQRPGEQEQQNDTSTASVKAADLEFFEKRVRPLLVTHCYECHAGDEKNGGLSLEAREHVMRGGDSGPAVIPGAPDKSLLIEAVRYKNRDLQMPPKAPLPDADVAVLVEWIARGAVDPREATADAPAQLKGMSLEEGQKFWSFQPVSNPDIPQVTNQAWLRTPIDAFILAKLEANGLEPAPPADKRALLRRISLDMLGLPPSIGEVEAFLDDDSPEAFNKVIERCLQSPQYGVRWGRHWLDVARYADSNGLDENLAFGSAWRYRDYVIDAFNNDKPYDRFVTEQIAGDLLPGANTETRIATGFMQLGAKVLAEPDREKLLMDTIDEQIDTLGKAMLGMTFGCARCHDHKFDPISQADYYALAAIFKSSKTFGDTNFGAIKHWHEVNLATSEEKERLKEIDAAIAQKQKAATAYKSAAVTAIRTQARDRVVEYLIAAAQFDLDTPLTEVAAIAEPLGLHPRILHQCRRHLAFHTDDDFLTRWHQLTQSGCVYDIGVHYGPLFNAASVWEEARKKDPKTKPHEDSQVMAAHAALYSNNSGLLTVPAKPEFAFDAATLAEYNRLADEARVLESFAPDMPSAMSIAEGSVVSSIPVHIRGSHRNLGEPIARGFPKVMQTTSVEPIWPRKSSGRLELAQWIASTAHPLTARVYVNRIWRWHFGSGLVGSTENFGVLGDKPSHPELLDWLARTFMESGWSTKELHRLILSSSVYQMSTLHPQASMAQGIDPGNQLLWRFQPRRLEAEQIRDSILYVAGQLDQTLGGKTVPLRNRQFVFDHTSIDHTKYDSLRRAVYLPVIRNNLYTLFEQFDFPDPTMPTGNRNSTTVAPQALLLMNSELVIDAAVALAKRLLTENATTELRVAALTQTLYARPPTMGEVEEIGNFLGEVIGPGGVADASIGTVDEHKAWALVCQSLLMSNEFFTVR